MTQRKKVGVVITARASYSRFKTALKAISIHPDLELYLIVAASALLNKYGGMSDVIAKDGFKIDAKVYNAIASGSDLIGQAKTTGLGIIELSSVFDNAKLDCVVTIADRYETMSTAVAASFMNIPLVHIQGGEVTGNIDEKVRHAITKLADLHLVSTQKSKERVIKMGEDPNNVFVTGCPSIDIAFDLKDPEKNKLNFDVYSKYGGVGKTPNYDSGYIVVMQHSVTSEYNSAQRHIEETLAAVNALDVPTFWFWPNMDVGTDGISKGLRIFREKNDNNNIHFFKNMEPTDFLILLKNSQCIVGNSSVGIRECSYMGVPSVNIGTRQEGREHGENITNVDYNQDDIKSAILHQMEIGNYKGEAIYGDGNAGVNIANAIASHQTGFTKKIKY